MIDLFGVSVCVCVCVQRGRVRGRGRGVETEVEMIVCKEGVTNVFADAYPSTEVPF